MHNLLLDKERSEETDLTLKVPSKTVLDDISFLKFFFSGKIRLDI